MTEGETKPTERDEIRCEFCERTSDLLTVEIQRPPNPNSLNPDLEDICTVIWKCPKCGCWQ